ncbi:hypothetical protein HCN44_005928 [Aphidius gifuensis]|uniref:Meckelin n=1 Tax=Aphidius gifuensis TaxID=684658 RepID=A0A834XV84_APHGI|nr:hypothetical protein HCN44_005928 [Aphidius gifuensis]
MSCDKCTNNLVSDKTRLKCICNENSRLVLSSTSKQCQSCSNGTILTSDKNDCIPCQINGLCHCPKNQIKVERSLNGSLLKNLECLPCSNNYYLSNDKSKCLPCFSTSNNYQEDIINTPSSMIHHKLIETQCLDNNTLKSYQNIRGIYLVNYELGSFESYYLRSQLKLTINMCQNGDELSCEHLSNICVLTLHIDSIACQQFIKIRTRKNLFYPAGEAENILSQRNISTRYTLIKNDINNQLKFIIARHSLNGDLQAISNLDSPYFPSCFNTIRFGINLKKTISTTASSLAEKKPEFLTPYIVFNDKQKKLIHQLPVFVEQNNNVNSIKKWQLIKKFFTLDTVTGYSTIIESVNSSYYKSSELIVIRYLKSLKILIKLQDERGKIYPPIFIVNYGELKTSDIKNNIDVSIDYEIVFSLTDDRFNHIIFIASGILIGIAIIFGILKMLSYHRRNDTKNNLYIIIWFIIYCLGSIGNVLIIVTLSCCIYIFIFYKGQSILHILLPDNDDEWIIKICTIIAFGSKLVEVLVLIWNLRKINIFFIDWEQPRNLQSNLHIDSPHTSLKKSYIKRFSDNSSSVVQTPSEIITSRKNKSSSKSSQSSTPSHQSFEQIEQQLSQNFIDSNFTINHQDFSQNWMVSIWRTYFVANKWLRIKTQRKININFQVLGTLLILEIIGFKNFNLAIPELTLDYQENNLNKNFTLNYAIISMIYILIYILQWIVSVFREKYVKNELQGFVDLCSVANISIFILSNDYYGYYIHGRSVHGYADTDLLSLINDLKREENNVCAHRGLIPGTTQQTFVISVSKNFKTFYTSLLDLENMNNKKYSRRNFVDIPSWEERWKMHIKLKKFLCGFIDHCFKNLDYTVKEKHVIEKLCDIEIFESFDKSIFYIGKFNIKCLKQLTADI